MTITKTPEGQATKAVERMSERLQQTEVKAQAFIAKVEEPAPRSVRLQSTLRIPFDLLTRMDKAAVRLGISRSAFIMQAVARELERMGA